MSHPIERSYPKELLWTQPVQSLGENDRGRRTGIQQERFVLWWLSLYELHRMYNTFFQECISFQTTVTCRLDLILFLRALPHMIATRVVLHIQQQQCIRLQRQIPRPLKYSRPKSINSVHVITGRISPRHAIGVGRRPPMVDDINTTLWIRLCPAVLDNLKRQDVGGCMPYRKRSLPSRHRHQRWVGPYR